MTADTIPGQRKQNIVDYLAIYRSITVHKASELNGVSVATARRDIDEMTEEGLCSRTHGGAVLNESISMETVHSEKRRLMVSEKHQIAMNALKMIHEGDSVFLDSGTTTYFLAKELKAYRNLTVITNNLDIAGTIELDGTSSMIVVGGMRRTEYSVTTGSVAEAFLRDLKVDLTFMGADAVDPDSGVYNSNFMELGTKRSMLECGRKTVLLVDHTKFRKKALVKICGFEAFDCIITDELDDRLRRKLEKNVRKLISL